jgi:hypothetical protein
MCWRILVETSSDILHVMYTTLNIVDKEAEPVQNVPATNTT